MMKPRAAVFRILAVVGLFVLAVVLWDTSLGRTVRRIATIEVRNESGQPIHGVVLVTQDADGNKHWAAEKKLQTGQTLSCAVSTSDLYLEVLLFGQGEEKHAYSEGGLATPGEIYSIVIKSSGKVTAGYVHD